MNDENKLALQGVLIVILLGTIIANGIILYNNLNSKKLVTEERITFNEDNCQNKSFRDTVNCLNEYVIENYNYTQMKDNDSRDLKDIIQNGGDCSDYTNFYVKKMQQYGYNGTYESFHADVLINGIQYGHAFALVWEQNNESNRISDYCVIDQGILHCVDLG